MAVKEEIKVPSSKEKEEREIKEFEEHERVITMLFDRLCGVTRETNMSIGVRTWYLHYLMADEFRYEAIKKALNHLIVTALKMPSLGMILREAHDQHYGARVDKPDEYLGMGL